MISERMSNLLSAIEDKHGVQATFLDSVAVDERFQGKPVWQGTVHVFRITHHLSAEVAYAWSHCIEGSVKRRIYTVLGVPPINSPVDAVRAAIVAEARRQS